MSTESPAPEPFPASQAWLLDNPLGRAQARGILRRLPIEPGLRVLDFGCGPGRVTIPAARLVGDGGEVFAVDLQPAMLAIVARRAAREGLRDVRTLEAAAGDGALPVGGYDLALLTFVLGEIPADLRPSAVREIASALRPGGALAVVEGLMDPHRQSRETVLALAEQAGLRLEREDQRLTSTLFLLRKSMGQEPGPGPG